MGIARSTCYHASHVELDDTTLVEAMIAICDEFEAYGWRRVRAALRQRGVVVNHKKIRRLMREHHLQPQRHRRHVATTDSDHDGPFFPDLAKDAVPDGPNQLWVADLTCGPVTGGFVYVAMILDAWSRRVVGYAIARSIDARLTLAALRAALATRRTAASCINTRTAGRNTLRRRIGTCSKLMAYAAPWPARQSLRQRQGRGLHEDAKGRVPRFTGEVYNRKRLHSALGYLSPVQLEEQQAGRPVKAAA